jgi:hypothetical protein
LIVKINFTNREYFEILEVTKQSESELATFLHTLILKNLNIKPSEKLLHSDQSSPSDLIFSFFHKKMMPKYSITQNQLAHIFKISQPAISKAFKNGTGQLGKKIRSFENEKDLEQHFVIPLFFQIYKNSYDSFIFDLEDPSYGLELPVSLHNPIEYILDSSNDSIDLKEIISVVIGYCWINGFTKEMSYDQNGFFFFYDTIKANLSINHLIEYTESINEDEKSSLLNEILENLEYIIEELSKPHDSFY